MYLDMKGDALRKLKLTQTFPVHLLINTSYSEHVLHSAVQFQICFSGSSSSGFLKNDFKFRMKTIAHYFVPLTPRIVYDAGIVCLRGKPNFVGS